MGNTNTAFNKNNHIYHLLLLMNWLIDTNSEINPPMDTIVGEEMEV